MKAAVNSFRVAYENWFFDDRFEQLLELLERYRDTVDSVALFTSATHPPLSLAQTKVRLDVMKKRIAEIEKRGFVCGINILGTIGHHCEDLSFNLSESYTRMTNIYGEVCEGSFCMNDKRFISEYIVPVYTMLAHASPQFIWIDDDVRYDHMPIENGCFCDNCIDIFNKTNGFSYSRAQLTEALNEYDVPLRKKWLRHQADTIISLFETIGRTVRDIDSSIMLGFMTGERFFEGYDFDGFARALSDNGKYQIMWRPGGGCYTDRIFSEFTSKANQIGRQNAYLPQYVTVIQSEVENFPYQMMKKSPRFTAIEAAMYIAQGCTGTAFNILPSETGENIMLISKHMDEIEQFTPFYRYLTAVCGRSAQVGIHTGWCPSGQSAVEGSFFVCSAGRVFEDTAEMFSLGLPQAHAFERASAYLLTGKSVNALTRDEILHILSSTVYMDATALTELEKMGFGELLGFTAGKSIPVDAREIYLEHELNSGFVGCLRNCRQAFNRGDSFEIIPTAADAEILCALVDYHGNTLARCSMGLFKNSASGTVCVGGYYPFSWVSDTFKTLELKRLFSGCIDCFPEDYSRVTTTVRCSDSGDRIAIVQNANPDTLKDLRLCVRTDLQTLTLTDMRMKRIELRAEGKAGDFKIFTIPKINPWEICVLEK